MAKFNFTRITNSIVNSNTSFNDAVDKDKPLTFIQWLKQINEQGNAKEFVNFYNAYINEWYDTQGVVQTNADRADSIKEQYVELFNDIILNYSTQAERRFILNIDYNNEVDVDVVIPFFSKKLKEVCIYFKGKREEVQQAVKKYESTGTNIGLERTIYNTVIESLQIDRSDTDFDTSNISLSSITNNLSVEIEEYYDMYTNYFDIDPNVPVEEYEVDGIRKEFFSSNSNDIDANLFIDFDQAIIDEIKKVPFYLISIGSQIQVNPTVESTDLQYLKKKHFINNIKDNKQDNLQINLKKLLIEKYSGSDFYYLSTNSTMETISGLLFEANEAAANFLNRRYPATATVPVTSFLFTPRELGLFFKPDKMGLLLYKAQKKSFSIDTASLSADTVYIFPDPFKYGGNVRGLTRNTFTSPIIHTMDVTDLTYDKSNEYKAGDVNISNDSLSFYGYESRK